GVAGSRGSGIHAAQRTNCPRRPASATIECAWRREPMDEFEYITVLLSIILGLGVTQLLSGFARLLRDGRSLARAWWVIVIVLNLLIAILQVWWVSFIWRDVQ